MALLANSSAVIQISIWCNLLSLSIYIISYNIYIVNYEFLPSFGKEVRREGYNPRLAFGELRSPPDNIHYSRLTGKVNLAIYTKLYGSFCALCYGRFFHGKNWIVKYLTNSGRRVGGRPVEFHALNR